MKGRGFDRKTLASDILGVDIPLISLQSYTYLTPTSSLIPLSCRITIDRASLFLFLDIVNIISSTVLLSLLEYCTWNVLCPNFQVAGLSPLFRYELLSHLRESYLIHLSKITYPHTDICFLTYYPLLCCPQYI